MPIQISEDREAVWCHSYHRATINVVNFSYWYQVTEAATHSDHRERDSAAGWRLGNQTCRRIATNVASQTGIMYIQN